MPHEFWAGFHFTNGAIISILGTALAAIAIRRVAVAIGRIFKKQQRTT